MIKVNKKKSDCPATFNALADAEMKSNLDLVKKKAFDKLKFKAYKNKVLAEALEKVFRKKCAYCEACFAAVAPADIEHFRPKSKTFPKGVPRKGFIGYYWLAADWDNLLISCIYCNRPNKHEVPGMVGKISIGKSEQFPLANEKLRCAVPSKVKLAAEDKVRLLVHPCRENPEQFFEFEETGPFRGNIKARKTLRGFRLQKAEKSIQVFALHRIDLVKARAALADSLLLKMKTLDLQFRNYDLLKSADRRPTAELIDELVAELTLHTDPDQPYSAMARQLLLPYLRMIKPKLVAVRGS